MWNKPVSHLWHVDRKAWLSCFYHLVKTLQQNTNIDASHLEVLGTEPPQHFNGCWSRIRPPIFRQVGVAVVLESLNKGAAGGF